MRFLMASAVAVSSHALKSVIHFLRSSIKAAAVLRRELTVFSDAGIAFHY